MSKIKDPSKKANKKKLPLHPAELVWYIVCGLVGLWGLTYIVLGLIAENLPITSEDNDFIKATDKFTETFGLDWLGWGLIILGIAAVGAVIVLLVLSNKADRDYEKNTRRAARLAQLEAEEEKEEAEQQKAEPQIIDAEVNDVKPEEPKEEEKPAEEPKEEPKPEEQPAEEVKEEAKDEEKVEEKEEPASEDKPKEE